MTAQPKSSDLSNGGELNARSLTRAQRRELMLFKPDGSVMNIFTDEAPSDAMLGKLEGLGLIEKPATGRRRLTALGQKVRNEIDGDAV